MIAAYKAMYQFNIDKSSPQYKGPFNQVLNAAQVFTPKDTAIVTPNSDTPYSMLQLDLRAEPIVFCVPAVDKSRYYSVQLTDLYTFNYGYVGTRATGNGAGCYMVAGPGWKGETPDGIAKVFNSETDFSLAIFRTQLFNAGRHRKRQENSGAIQGAAPCPQFLGQPAPRRLADARLPQIHDGRLQDRRLLVPEFPAAVRSGDRAGGGRKAAAREIRATSAYRPGKPYNFSKLSLEHASLTGLGIKEGYKEIEQRRANIGKAVNGWRIGDGVRRPRFFDGDYALRAAAALAGIYGNDADEALYPLAIADNKGEGWTASKHKYTITFPAGGFRR